ncbi:MAG: hypothetical protein WA918_09800 [Erythrobacter sp.]
MLVERRRAAFPRDLLTRTGIAWLLVSALLLVINWSAIASYSFPDPDDTLRLLQVRDLLAGQSWFDVTQTRIDAAGGGVRMHWSRLVDIPLALVILALTPLLGTAGAEHAALVIVPLVTLLLAMLLAARIAWRFMGEDEATLTILVIALAAPLLHQLGPMRIDHHGWQLVCAMAAINGLTARSPEHGGRIVGASLATWLAISIEGLPLAAAILAILAWRWLAHHRERIWLVSAMQTFALTGIALFLLTRGIGDLATYCDAISPLHLAMFVWGALVLTVLARFEPMPPILRLAGFGVAGGGAAALILSAAPQCATGGGFSALDPLVTEFWLRNVKEGQPMWVQDFSTALHYLAPPAIGLASAINLSSRSRDWLRQFWREYALILGAAIFISLLVARAGAVACLLAAPPFAWQLQRWLKTARKIEVPVRRAGAMLLIALALMPTLPLALGGAIIPARAASGTGSQATTPRLSQCRIEDSAATLAALENGEVFAPLDIAPKLLFHTDHTVPATAHHRGNDTMRLVIATFIGSSEDARTALTERGSEYLALCLDRMELSVYQRANPRGFATDLLSGAQLDWLEPVPTSAGTTLKIYRIMPG